MLSSDFLNVLSCLKSLSFQWPLEFREQPEVLGRVRGLANYRSLVFCKRSLDAIERRKKFRHAYEGLRSPHASALHRNSPGFRKKN